VTGELVSDPAAADGMPILVGGKERRLVFGFAAFKVLEDDFGGIAQWAEHFAPGGWKTRRMSAIESGVRAGLKHYELEADARMPFDLERLVAAIYASGMPHAEWWAGCWAVD